MPYAVEIQASADDDFDRLDPGIARQVRSKLEELAGNADVWPHRALTGRLRGVFRRRVGDYRVLYTLDRQNRRITVRAVQHRSEAYRRS